MAAGVPCVTFDCASGPARDRPARGQRPPRRARVDRRACPPRCSGSAPTTSCGSASAPARSTPLRSGTPTRSPGGGSRSSRRPSPAAPAGRGSPPCPTLPRARTRRCPVVRRRGGHARGRPGTPRSPSPRGPRRRVARRVARRPAARDPRARGGAPDGRPAPVPPGAGRGRRCRPTSRCATRPPTAGTSAAARSPSWPRTCCAAAPRSSRSSPGPTCRPTAASVLGQGCTVEVEFWEEDVEGQLVAPRRNRYAQRLPRGAATSTTEVARRRRADPAADGRARPSTSARSRSTSSTPGSTAATRRGTRPGSTGWPGSPAPPPPASPAGRRGSSPATSCATRCAASTCSRPWVRRIHLVTAGQVPDWLDPDHPAGRGRRPRGDPAPGRAAHVQLPRDRGGAAQGARPGRALRLPQRRLLPRPAARPGGVLQPGRPGRGVVLAEHDRPRRDARRPAVPQGGLEQPAAAAGRLRRRRDRQPRARALPAPPLGARGDRAAVPRRGGARPRARRSAPTPTSRCSARSPSTTGCSPARAYAAESDARLHQHQQQRPGVAAEEGPGAATRTSSAWPTTTTTPLDAERLDRTLADVHDDVLPCGRPVGAPATDLDQLATPTRRFVGVLLPNAGIAVVSTCPGREACRPTVQECQAPTAADLGKCRSRASLGGARVVTFSARKDLHRGCRGTPPAGLVGGRATRFLRKGFPPGCSWGCTGRALSRFGPAVLARSRAGPADDPQIGDVARASRADLCPRETMGVLRFPA